MPRRRRRRRRPAAAAALAAAALLGVVAAACGGSSPTVAAPPTPSITAGADDLPADTPTTVATTAPPTTTPAPTWVLGATPLPTTPDGLGIVQPTPAALVDRRLQAPDTLPPPASGGFESSVAPLDDAVRARIAGTWQEGCPVSLDDLRYLTLSFWGFDDRPHTGELIVGSGVADEVVGVFHRLFDARFPIEEMRLVTQADLDAAPTGDGNNTASFVCRPVRGGHRFSAHASGLAIDIDPFQNPYQRGDVVLPELASAYLDRSQVRPGMILPGDAVTAAFADAGWTWGGTWDSPRDLMHFSETGG